MTVFVTVETFQGCIDSVEVYSDENKAIDAEKNWLAENHIEYGYEREGKDDCGTSFNTFVCELK